MLPVLSILVVEDNPGDARLIDEALRGYRDVIHVEYVERIGQALQLLANRAFDVVLLDLGLPDSRGLETLTRLCAAAPHMPVVVLTATAEDEMAINALKLGAQDYVVKGQFDRWLLLRSIRYARERCQQKEALLRSWREFRAIIEMAPDGIGLIRDGRILYANHALSSSLAYQSQDLVGVRLTDLLASGDSEEGALVELLSCVPGATPRRREVRFRRRDDQIAILEVCVGAPIEFEGAEALPLTARDVTERKKMEAHLIQTDRIAALGSLSAGIAHEINNPLAYVIVNLGFATEELATLAAQESLPPVEGLRRAENMLAKVREGTERVRRVVARLNAFTRIESGQPRPVDLGGIIAAVGGMVGNEIRHRARLVTELRDTPPVMGDDARLGQVLLNLVLSAALNIPEGRADQNEIRVTTKRNGAGFVMIEVRDTGPGIPSENLSHIFEPFVTFPASAGGGGLGLSIARSIVTGLGGRIEAESTVGRGSVFRVALPAADAKLETRPEGHRPPQLPRRRGRVLIVDDEPEIGESLGAILSDSYDVIAVDSGREALTRLTGPEAFDVILCDLMMPVMTGMDLYEQAMHSAPHMAQRFIFMTGGAFTSRARQFLESVDNLTLEKPVDIGSMLRLLADQVNVHELDRNPAGGRQPR